MKHPQFRILATRILVASTVSLVAIHRLPMRLLAADVAAKPDAEAEAKKKKAEREEHKGWTDGGKPAVKTGPALTADSLLKEMEEALAVIVNGTKTSKTDKFNEKSKEEAPFWDALKGIATEAGNTKKAMAAKDKAYFKGEEALGRNISELNVTWKLLKKKDKDMEKALFALTRSYRMFDEQYGLTAAEVKKGGDLTDAEKTKLEQTRKEEAKLTEDLKALKKKFKAEKDKVALQMVNDIEKKAKRGEKAKGEGEKTYVLEETLLEQEQDELYAYGQVLKYEYPKQYTEWETLTTDETWIDSYYTEDISVDLSWDFASASVESYGDYYDIEVEASSEEIASSESYAEEYSESEATEEDGEEAGELEGEEENGESDEDEASDDEDESLDDEGDSEDEEDDDEDDDDDDEDDDDGDDDDGDGDEALLTTPSPQIIMVAVAHQGLLDRYWPRA